MDLVDDHQLAGLGAQVGVRVVEAPEVGRPLRVKIHGGVSQAPGNLQCERGLAYLSRAEQDDGRYLAESCLDLGTEAARYGGQSIPEILMSRVKFPG